MTVMSDVAETTPDDEGAPILVVDDLRTQFAVPAGSVKAVDGVSFEGMHLRRDIADRALGR